MAVNVDDLQYPFDPTGTMLANLVEGEQQILTPPNFRDYYFIVPKAAPFFADSMRITFKGLDNAQRTLIEGVDYYLTHWFISASRACAKSVYGSVTFLDKTMSGVVTLKYQTIGGIWVLQESEIAEILANQLLNPRITTWETIVDMPIAFPVIDHEWDLADMVGASGVVDAIDRITEALNESGGNAITEHIANKDNPHDVTKTQVGLGNVQNYPVASITEAQQGTSNLVYMTALRVKNAIDAQAGAMLLAHTSNQANPHNVTASQLGLGNVQNYSMATNAEAIQGSLSTRYMSPATVKAAIDNFANTTFANHVNNKLNPHEVDKVQVGLGLVDNFATASADEARLGNANNVFMTPLRVRQAIQALAGGDLGNHVNDYNNPHQTTKAQVGLGNVMNYGVATSEQTLAGASDILYTTPKGVVYAIQQLVANDYWEHVVDINNPHKVTAAQVGAYSIAQSNTALAAKLDVGAQAADTKLFDGMNIDQYMDYVLAGKVADSFMLGGRTDTEYRTWVLSGTAADSSKLNGLTLAQIIEQLQSGTDASQWSAEQRRHESIPYSDTAGDYNWIQIASIPIEDPATPLVPFPDGQWLVAGTESYKDKTSGLYYVRCNTRGPAGAKVTLQVRNLAGVDTGVRFGWLINSAINEAEVWIRTNVEANVMSVTELNKGVGTTESDSGGQEIEPTGITYVTENNQWADAKLFDGKTMAQVTAAILSGKAATAGTADNSLKLGGKTYDEIVDSLGSSGTTSNAKRLDGQLPSYYATAADQTATANSLSNLQQTVTQLSQTVGTQGQNITSLSEDLNTFKQEVETALDNLAQAFQQLAAAQG